MTVLITGGAGFIGQYLAARLVPSRDVVALDLLNPQVHVDPKSASQRFPGPVVRGDVSDLNSWAELSGIDCVVHLAAETGTGQSMYEQERYRRVNVGGTRMACEFARRVGAPIVVMSSRAVYGNGRFVCPDGTDAYGTPECDGAVPASSREGDPHRPVSVYGETKSEAEAVAAEFAADIPVDIVRPQNVVGYGQALHNPYTGVLAAFLARLREGRSLSIYGDGTATRDFIHVSDVAALLAWLVEHPAPMGQPRVLNSGTGTRTTLTQLAEYSCEAADLSETLLEYVDVHRAGDIDHAVADLAACDAAGAPRAKFSSREAVHDFIRRSWNEPGVQSSAWDDALSELGRRGLTS